MKLGEQQPAQDPLQAASSILHSRTFSHQSIKLLRFLEDNALIGLIFGKDESAYSFGMDLTIQHSRDWGDRCGLQEE